MERLWPLMSITTIFTIFGWSPRKATLRVRHLDYLSHNQRYRAKIKKLEHQLGKALFEKEGRGIALTEAGIIAFSYAEKIFQMGNELNNLLKHQLDATNTILKIGVISSLSRNFVQNFIKPVLNRTDVQIHLISGSEIALLPQLKDHRLDLILSNSLQNIQQQGLISHQVDCKTASEHCRQTLASR